MWDNHRLLNRVANVLYAVGVVCVLYAVLMMVIRLPIFPLRHVSVSGQISHTTREQVDSIMREQVRGNFFTLDLERTRLAFEKLPWVRQANLRRAWPDRLSTATARYSQPQATRVCRYSPDRMAPPPKWSSTTAGSASCSLRWDANHWNCVYRIVARGHCARATVISLNLAAKT